METTGTKHTPAMSQYLSIKERHKDCILLFRMGDFYEIFFEDARIAANVLDVVLTARGKSGDGDKIPMCGFPHHAADTYIARLVKAGHKVAVCEQMEDPATAKGLVKRDILRIVTAGTYIDESDTQPRYLACLAIRKNGIPLAFIDATGGTIFTRFYPDAESALAVLAKLPVCECVYPIDSDREVKKLFAHPLVRLRNIALSPHDEWCFNTELAQKTLCEHFGTRSLRGFGIEDADPEVAAAGALLEYIRQMNRQPVRHIDGLSRYDDSEYVFISPAACYGLEIESLIRAIDRTMTPMGRRTLRHWIYQPLKDAGAIRKRQNAVSILIEQMRVRETLETQLRNMPDIEKSISRISCGYPAARDLLHLRTALARLPELQAALTPVRSLNAFFTVEDIPGLRTLLENAIDPEMPPANTEGRIIRPGYNAELDSWRDLQNNGRDWIRDLQQKEIARTGINSLKISFNKVFGYYIEISKTNLSLVPENYIRKQTLVNGERFITPELKEFEDKMLSAEEQVRRIEADLIRDIQIRILDHSAALHSYAAAIAGLDVLLSFAAQAIERNYTAPEVNDGYEIFISNGRHPVVEQSISEPFIANDTLLDCKDNHLLILTGPNMAGKSTYIRQTAILTVMAQTGSYIPAERARIGITDKIFTRIGAHDEISKGQSTFMVEMSEAAGILNNLSQRSLVILDEIGRGTSTYDGLSLAWAIAEHLQNKKVRTLFATHFHELTAIAQDHPGVKNYNVAVREWEDEIVFLHKIIPGGTDESYGIYVARLAGIPLPVVKRAQEILMRLEVHGNLQEKILEARSLSPETQFSLFHVQSDTALEMIKDELKELDVNEITPMQALQKLAAWKKKIL